MLDAVINLATTGFIFFVYPKSSKSKFGDNSYSPTLSQINGWLIDDDKRIVLNKVRKSVQKLSAAKLESLSKARAEKHKKGKQLKG